MTIEETGQAVGKSTTTGVVNATASDPRGGSLAAWRPRLQRWGPLMVLVVLSIGFGLSSSNFFTSANLYAIADQAAVPLVLATGITFVVLLGSIDLSGEGVMGASSIVVALLVANSINHNHLGDVGLLAGVLVGGALGLANGLLHTLLRVPSLMVTLGMWFIGLGIATWLYPSQQPTITDPSLLSWALGRWWGFSRLDFVALAVLLGALVVQRWTRLGRYAFVIGGGEETAKLIGIRLKRWKVATFAFAGLLAGLAGVMASLRLGVGSVQAGSGMLFPAVSAVVVGGTSLSGGRGGVVQTGVGVLILGVLANGMVLVGVDPYLQKAVQGAIIIAAVGGSSYHLRQRLRVVK